jgi:hypothetical protein
MGTGDVSAIFCALAGRLDPKRIPDPHLSWALLPGVVEIAATRVHFGIVMGALMTSLIGRRLRGAYGPDGNDVGLLAREERARAITLLRLFQNADGSMNSNTVQTALLLCALHAAGLPTSDGPVKTGVDWLLSRRVETADGVWFDVFASDVWSTAFTVRALNRLGATRTMEEYIRYVFNVVVGETDDEIGPVFGITFERELTERQVAGLAGYRAMGPVRVGNDAWRQRQNDVYGSVVLAS